MSNTNTQPSQDRSAVLMNRNYCSTKERISYIVNTFTSGFSFGNFKIGETLFDTKFLALSPDKVGYARASLSLYDLINDSFSAIIIDKMRSRWGKFKPFQFLSLIPNVLLELSCILFPVLIAAFSFQEKQTLWLYIAIIYSSETISAFVGGGGYINNVFTANPNERAALLTASKLIGEFGTKLPGQILKVLYDLMSRNVFAIDIIKAYVIVRSICLVMSTVSNVHWAMVSKERVMQKEKAPNIIPSIKEALKNRPLMAFAISGVVDGIDLGKGGNLYYSDVVKFTMMPEIGGLFGSPLTYVSYAIMPKLRKRFSTRGLWFLQRGSIFISEGLFFLVGLIGGKKKGLYLRIIPMTITFAIGNCIEMFFYATKKVVKTELNYEIIDYGEWKCGYRTEGILNFVLNYFGKIFKIFIDLINGLILKYYAKIEVGLHVEQSPTTKWRVFLTGFGLNLIFDFLCFFPMIFYNIDKKTRNRMYTELDQRRAAALVSAAQEEIKAELKQ